MYQGRAWTREYEYEPTLFRKILKPFLPLLLHDDIYHPSCHPKSSTASEQPSSLVYRGHFATIPVNRIHSMPAADCATSRSQRSTINAIRQYLEISCSCAQIIL